MRNNIKDETTNGITENAHENTEANDIGAPPLQPFSKAPTATKRNRFHPDVPSGGGRNIDFHKRSLENHDPNDQKSIDAQHLLIGREIHLKGGKITKCNRLTLDGQVEDSSLMGAQSLEVSPVGIFKGKAEVDDAVIAGRFDGSLTARKRLTVRKTGAINGKVSYGSIIIEPGGEISGEMQSINDET